MGNIVLDLPFIWAGLIAFAVDRQLAYVISVALSPDRRAKLLRSRHGAAFAAEGREELGEIRERAEHAIAAR